MQQRVSPSTRGSLHPSMMMDEESMVVSSSSSSAIPPTTTTQHSTSSTASLSNNTEENTSSKNKPIINVYDLYSVKYMLDSFVRSVLIEEKSFKEDHTLSNFKLITGFLACGGAIMAYFTKTPLYALLLCIAYVIVFVVHGL